MKIYLQGDRRPQARQAARLWWHVFSILAGAGLLLALGACSAGAGPTQSSRTTATPPTPTPTRPAIPSGTTLFQSDWSHGLAQWGGSAGWKIVNGMPQSDLSNNNAFVPPYKLTIPNYAIEFRFQIVRVPHNGGYFIVKANKTPGKDGYVAGILNLLSPAPHSPFANPQIQIYLDPISAMEAPMRPTDYEAGSFWHTFRVEVRESSANFLADGFSKGTATSTETNSLSNGPLQLISAGAVVRVSNVRIIAL